MATWKWKHVVKQNFLINLKRPTRSVKQGFKASNEHKFFAYNLLLTNNCSNSYLGYWQERNKFRQTLFSNVRNGNSLTKKRLVFVKKKCSKTTSAISMDILSVSKHAARNFHGLFSFDIMTSEISMVLLRCIRNAMINRKYSWGHLRLEIFMAILRAL